MNKEKSIEVLNTLVKINNDRMEGYEKAATETEEAYLKTSFTRFAKTSKKCKDELSSEIINLGGTPTNDTKVAGELFRVWMDVKTVLTGHDSKAILNSCQLGEEVAIEAYENAITNHHEHLTEEQQLLLQTQYAWIMSDHSQLKGMKQLVMEH